MNHMCALERNHGFQVLKNESYECTREPMKQVYTRQYGPQKRNQGWIKSDSL